MQGRQPKPTSVSAILRLTRTFFLAGALATAYAQSAADVVYDGHWWKRVMRHDRLLGYLDGGSDCRQYERLESIDKRKYRSNYDARELVIDFYEQEGNDDLLITEVIERIEGESIAPGSDNPVAEYWLEKHGYYDGQWWSGSDQRHLGFIEGYISCLPDGGRLYPKAPEVYRDLVDQHYSDPQQTDGKIADVLTLFAEKALATPRVSPACETRDDLTGTCFDLRGRLAMYARGSLLRMWIVGTRRMLAVPGGYPFMPDELARRINWHTRIFADYRESAP